jgi:hypothetical protein
MCVYLARRRVVTHQADAVQTDLFPCPDDTDWQVLLGPPAAAAMWTQVPNPA